ncbi:hypothetical protein NQZ68_026038, partial [Dissostichus eleginoides]
MFTVGVRSKPPFLHFLVKTEPAASQINLKEFPSIGRFDGDVTEAPDTFSGAKDHVKDIKAGTKV